MKILNQDFDKATIELSASEAALLKRALNKEFAVLTKRYEKAGIESTPGIACMKADCASLRKDICVLVQEYYDMGAFPEN